MKHLLLTTIAAVVLVGCGNPEADRALFKAATEGNIKGIKQLIADGADVNAKNRDGTTPLQTAAIRGHKEFLQLLIANGADVNAKDWNGRTSLDWAEDVDEDDSIEVGPLSESEREAARKEIATLLRKHGGKTAEELKAEGK